MEGPISVEGVEYPSEKRTDQYGLSRVVFSRVFLRQWVLKFLRVGEFSEEDRHGTTFGCDDKQGNGGSVNWPGEKGPIGKRFLPWITIVQVHIERQATRKTLTVCRRYA